MKVIMEQVEEVGSAVVGAVFGVAHRLATPIEDSKLGKSIIKFDERVCQ